jgi:hypothetical protein
MRKKGRTPTAAHSGDVGRNYIVVLFSSNVVPVMRKVSGMNDTHSPGVIYTNDRSPPIFSIPMTIDFYIPIKCQ